LLRRNRRSTVSRMLPSQHYVVGISGRCQRRRWLTVKRFAAEKQEKYGESNAGKSAPSSTLFKLSFDPEKNAFVKH
jgi:hypothetical protein